jgi:phage terminase large subunit-like protein
LTIQSGDSRLDELMVMLDGLANHRKFNQIEFFKPYGKQADFMQAGLSKRERLLMAANQVGKTTVGAYEAAVHLTGLYPPDWAGRKFRKPVRAWAGGVSSVVTRDTSQAKLCGPPGVAVDHGSGFLPRAEFVDTTLARGAADAFDTIVVKHYTDGIHDGNSTIQFKAYEQGRKKFQSATLDFVWLDEEPPMDIYMECMARITATKGMIYLTFTPLEGMSEVVIRYLNDPSPDRSVTTMTIDEAEHISEEDRKKIIEGYLPHERDARTKGIPMLGSGKVFKYSEETILEPTMRKEEIPGHWAKLWGVDFGINHPFGAVLLAWDRDADVVHILHTIRVADQNPLQHWDAMKRIGAQVPVAWPQDGAAREKGSGIGVAQIYRNHGAPMLPKHATHPDGSVSTEAGIALMQEYMATGRFKVANHLSEWIEEYRMYHRKDGQIVKVHDDLMSATRIAMMMLRYAKTVPLGSAPRGVMQQRVASGVDFDLF